MAELLHWKKTNAFGRIMSWDTIKLDFQHRRLIKQRGPFLPADKYMVINVRKDRAVIKEICESWTQKPYVVGSAYYQLTKKEKIQASKNILIKHKKNGKVYEGDAARKLLGLPDYEVKCEPASLPDWSIYIQSGSVNRLLAANTELIVLL